MRTRLFGTIAIAALALTACGGDDDGGSGSGSGSPQRQVADMVIEAFDDAAGIEGMSGLEIDEGCVRDKFSKLSDADARAILAAGPDGDPEVSEEAEVIGAGMFDCFDMSGIDFGDLDIDLEDIDLEDLDLEDLGN